MDIYALAPKIVINEVLLGEGQIYDDEFAHIILDFGIL
jgi:hypothetical protein